MLWRTPCSSHPIPDVALRLRQFLIGGASIRWFWDGFLVIGNIWKRVAQVETRRRKELTLWTEYSFTDVDPEPKLPLTVRRRSEAQNPFGIAMSDASEVGRGVRRGAQELDRISARLEGVVDGEQHPVNPDGVGGCPER